MLPVIFLTKSGSLLILSCMLIACPAAAKLQRAGTSSEISRTTTVMSWLCTIAPLKKKLRDEKERNHAGRLVVR